MHRVTTKQPSSQRKVALCGLVLALVALGYVAVHLRLVHDRSYEYRWTPSAAAPRIQFAGRDYSRSSGQPATALPAGLVPLGRTEGGGRIYGPAGSRDSTLVILHVVTGDGTFTYALSGGP